MRLLCLLLRSPSVLACTQTCLIFLFVLFENIGERSERARTSEEREKEKQRKAIFFFPHPYPLALAVNKSPAVSILQRALDGL